MMWRAPPYSTGSTGIPVAVRTLPSVQAIRSAGMTSIFSGLLIKGEHGTGEARAFRRSAGPVTEWSAEGGHA
jgi:hypothetical protein